MRTVTPGAYPSNIRSQHVRSACAPASQPVRSHSPPRTTPDLEQAMGTIHLDPWTKEGAALMCRGGGGGWEVVGAGYPGP